MLAMQPNHFVPTVAMAIAAHPDDIEFGCAGTCAKWAQQGARVVYVLVTSGNAGTHDPTHTRDSLAALREQEQLAAAAVCGVSDVEFLRYDDGEVAPSLALRMDLVRLIRKHKPEVVIAMDPRMIFSGDDYINHPDHRAVGLATLEAVFPAAAMPLWHPELGAPHRVREVWVQWAEDPNVWVDISDTLALKVQALMMHKSQVEPKVAEMVQRWAWEAGRGLCPTEAFKVMRLIKRDPSLENGQATAQDPTSAMLRN
ncbi:MAG: PIG-L deacetylase family protein [Thermoflexales bacterium]